MPSSLSEKRRERKLARAQSFLRRMGRDFNKISLICFFSSPDFPCKTVTLYLRIIADFGTVSLSCDIFFAVRKNSRKQIYRGFPKKDHLDISSFEKKTYSCPKVMLAFVT